MKYNLLVTFNLFEGLGGEGSFASFARLRLKIFELSIRYPFLAPLSCFIKNLSSGTVGDYEQSCTKEKQGRKMNF